MNVERREGEPSRTQWNPESCHCAEGCDTAREVVSKERIRKMAKACQAAQRIDVQIDMEVVSVQKKRSVDLRSMTPQNF